MNIFSSELSREYSISFKFLFLNNWMKTFDKLDRVIVLLFNLLIKLTSKYLLGTILYLSLYYLLIVYIWVLFGTGVWGRGYVGSLFCIWSQGCRYLHAITKRIMISWNGKIIGEFSPRQLSKCDLQSRRQHDLINSRKKKVMNYQVLLNKYKDEDNRKILRLL